MTTASPIATETTEQRIVRIRRERVAELLEETGCLPDPRNHAPGMLAHRGYVLESARVLIRALMREPAHASAARVALDALGALWAVL